MSLKVPSLRGRMVHRVTSRRTEADRSRPYGDGWYLSYNYLYIIIEPEDSGIDQLSRQRSNELCRYAAHCGAYIGLCGNLKPNRFSVELKENALRVLQYARPLFVSLINYT